MGKALVQGHGRPKGSAPTPRRGRKVRRSPPAPIARGAHPRTPSASCDIGGLRCFSSAGAKRRGTLRRSERDKQWLRKLANRPWRCKWVGRPAGQRRRQVARTRILPRPCRWPPPSLPAPESTAPLPATFAFAASSLGTRLSSLAARVGLSRARRLAAQIAADRSRCAWFDVLDSGGRHDGQRDDCRSGALYPLGDARGARDGCGNRKGEDEAAWGCCARGGRRE